MKENKLKVMILEGGMSFERYTSLESSVSVQNALKNYDKYEIDVVDLKNMDFCDKFIKNRPDVVFNLLQGKYGEDGRIQGMLDILKIPYTHSGVLASAIGMNKWVSKMLCEKIGLNTAKGVLLNKENYDGHLVDNIKKPFIVKPNDEGQSLGVTLVNNDETFNFDGYNWDGGKELIVEEFIKGREFSVTVLNNLVLEPVEIKSKNIFFDTEAKDNEEKTSYSFNTLSNEKNMELKNIAMKIHKIIGCKDISRSDFILNEVDNLFYYLETNTHPGLTYPHSLTPMSLENSGYSLLDLCVYLIENASYEGYKDKKHYELVKIA